MSRYPGYDVLSKRNSPSWNEQTRRVVDERLGLDPERHVFFSDDEWRALKAVCARIIPQPPERDPPAPIAAMIDEKMSKDARDGYRNAAMPEMGEAWRRGLEAIDDEARSRFDASFCELDPTAQDQLLRGVQGGDVKSVKWTALPPHLFFSLRIQHDIISAYYALPCAWNEIGFGGPASPRGYVRMNYDRRDPWEAAEARPGQDHAARRENARLR